MRIPLLLASLALLTPGASFARDAGPCPAPEAHQFDFWIGDWDIRQQILQADGTWLPFEAHTSVSPTLGGCALIEHWEGTVQFFWEGMEAPEPMRGLSVRAYDPGTGTWAIHWMDTRHPVFQTPYTGGFQDADHGTFFREWESPQGRRTGRITFTRVAPDSVDWELAFSKDDGATWTALWRMAMHRSGR